MQRHRSAFTLVELLVVMAIIGFLAGMMFPIFGAMRTRAKITKTRSQAGQIDTAWKSYQLKERSLPGAPKTDQNMDANAWTLLGPYIEATNLMTYLNGVPVDPWGNVYKMRFFDDDRDIKVWSYGPDKTPGVSTSTNGGDDVRSW